mmetsp:Transcript_18232/g.32655  ORF Transcript_18232/g.32655 Transcript_18232/m.32655 type:complete len:378 (+) Transcript_18232:54-1187(+)
MLSVLFVMWGVGVRGMGDAEGFNQSVDVQKKYSGASSARRIRGNIKMSGTMYQTVCSCSDKLDAGPTCPAPTLIKIHAEELNSDKALSQDDLHKLIDGPGNFANYYAYVEQNSFYDIDHRISDRVLGTPGGEYGEILGGLAAFEFLTEQKLTYDDVYRYLKGWLKSPERGIYQFVFFTDETSVSSLEDHMGVVGLNLTKPGSTIDTNELKNQLVKKKNQGTKYIKAVLGNPTAFYYTKTLPGDTIKALFEILWHDKDTDSLGLSLKSKINIKILEDDDEGTNSSPSAWLNIFAGQNCETSKRAPMFAPSKSSRKSVLVNHPGAVSSLRLQIAKYFNLHTPEYSTEQILKLIERMGAYRLDLFAKKQKSMPYYTVRIE